MKIYSEDMKQDFNSLGGFLKYFMYTAVTFACLYSWVWFSFVILWMLEV